MLAEPHGGTLFVKPVGAWERYHFIADAHIVHADAAFRFSFWAEHLLIYVLLGKCRDCIWGCWTRCI
jgi:hypothetical protein